MSNTKRTGISGMENREIPQTAQPQNPKDCMNNLFGIKEEKRKKAEEKERKRREEAERKAIEKKYLQYKTFVKKSFNFDPITSEALRIYTYEERKGQTEAILDMMLKCIPNHIWVEARRAIIDFEETPDDYMDKIENPTVKKLYYNPNESM